jgi:hypothetical protein
MAKSMQIAADLASKPPIAMKLNKQHFRTLSEPAYRLGIEEGRKIQREAYGSGEPQETQVNVATVHSIIS